MSESLHEDDIFRFAAGGASGTVKLERDHVAIKAQTMDGEWELSVPLESLSPRYSKLRCTAPNNGCGLLLSSLFVIAGITLFVSAVTFMPKLAGAFLVAVGSWSTYYLSKHRKADWIMIASNDGGHGVSYTRQGPDLDRADEFTELLMQRIKQVSKT